MTEPTRMPERTNADAVVTAEPAVVTLPNDAKVQSITYYPKTEVVCSVAHDPFQAMLEIEYWPENVIIEYISFEDWLAHVSSQSEMLVEELARLVFDKLRALLGDEAGLKVEVTAMTDSHAPITVKISW